jgi:hypothetical protein
MHTIRKQIDSNTQHELNRIIERLIHYILILDVSSNTSQKCPSMGTIGSALIKELDSCAH